MSPTKKRQTMAKVARERELKERRALKQEKKDARRAAAAERGTDNPDDPYGPPLEDGPTATEEEGEPEGLSRGV